MRPAVLRLRSFSRGAMVAEHTTSTAGKVFLARRRASPVILRHLRPALKALSAPHPGLWALVALLIAADLAWLSLARITVAPLGLAVLTGTVSLLLGASLFWSLVKPEPILRAMALSSAFLLAFTGAVGVLHELAATLALPLADPSLARIEAALGFDWVGYLGWLEDHPHLGWILALAYHSSGPQIGVVVIALSATRRFARLWAYLQLFAVLLTVVVAIAALVPAVGPYAYYRPGALPPEGIETVGALWHLDALARLRNGTMPVIALSEMRGLVTFPSFHVCLAIITAWALAPIPLLGPVAIALNLTVAIATLSAGGHYLPDLIAGALLALGALASRWRNAPSLEREKAAR
ncbi:phosphatase PAP2 family protein [Methylobacterium sp. A54F]